MEHLYLTLQPPDSYIEYQEKMSDKKNESNHGVIIINLFDDDFEKDDESP